MTQRLLLFFSYLGTNYKGAQRLLPRESPGPDVETIQGILEWGVNKVLQRRGNIVNLSSRTDTGVHAIEATAHFDNQYERVNPTYLCQAVNLCLENNQTDLRIKRIIEVPPDYSCRHSVLYRRYCYRIAVIKDNYIDSCLNTSNLTSTLPITELYRCEPVLQPLNISAIFDACKLFLGTQNFRTFATLGRKDKAQKDEEDYIKTILRVSFGKSTNEDIHDAFDFDNESQQKLDFYEFHIDGTGFIRRQVRKMVGALLGIGKGLLTENDIKFMLHNPSPSNWKSIVPVASPHGLYLKSVTYRDIPIVRL